MQGLKVSFSTNRKIPEIEGVRALAILMVLFFHFFARWTPPIYSQDIYPYQIEIARKVSQYGYMGVQLFFMVSGFVILKSLENQASLATFARARIKRIFPSLYIAIPVIYITCNLLNQEFIAPIPISSFLPSLTLVGPDFLNLLFSTNFIWTTGVLWSLFIEIQFYLVAGVLFFNLKKYTFVTKLFVIALSMQSLKIFLVLSESEKIKTFDALLPLHNYIWWFLAGATFYTILNSKKSYYLPTLIMISIFFNMIPLIYESSRVKYKLILCTIVIVFYLIFYFLTIKPAKIAFLRSSVLIWLGGISYEFYLIHESLGISVISKINQFGMTPGNSLIQFLLLTFVIAILIALSVLLKKLSDKSLILLLKLSKLRGWRPKNFNSRT